MKLHMDLWKDSYNIHIERGALARVGELFPLNRRVLIVTDDGVPQAYAKTVCQQCREAHVVCLPAGEASKSMENYSMLLKTLLDRSFDRSDCVLAVGGGVVGDLAGFVAATYMRGIDFYNLPTTLLSQVDSSIGGKVAIDFCGVKNIVGAFYQPKGVLIDPTVLDTLPRRQLACGFAEAVKMACTSDAELFALFESGEEETRIDEVIERSLRIKKAVVEADEKENGLRRVLNFGHTLGHGIETVNQGALYHGECVALGMLPLCSREVKARLLPILRRLGLPTKSSGDPEEILAVTAHDKKRCGNTLSVVFVERVGEFSIRQLSMDAWERTVRQAWEDEV